MAVLMLLAACQQEQAPEQAQRFSLEDARHTVDEPLASPDTAGASWSVSENAQAIRFGHDGKPPLLSLECAVGETPPQLRIVRHAPARPGQQALFPVLGNGTVSRFKVDAAANEGEWHWEGSLPAGDPMFDVFTGPLDLEATLPGGGTLAIAGSRIPGEFVAWCRAGGRLMRTEAAEEAAEAEESAAATALRQGR